MSNASWSSVYFNDLCDFVFTSSWQSCFHHCPLDLHFELNRSKLLVWANHIVSAHYVHVYLQAHSVSRRLPGRQRVVKYPWVQMFFKLIRQHETEVQAHGHLQLKPQVAVHQKAHHLHLCLHLHLLWCRIHIITFPILRIQCPIIHRHLLWGQTHFIHMLIRLPSLTQIFIIKPCLPPTCLHIQCHTLRHSIPHIPLHTQMPSHLTNHHHCCQLKPP